MMTSANGTSEMTPVVNRRDLDAARSLPHAVIFFWANWSIPAIQSRVVVEQARCFIRF